MSNIELLRPAHLLEDLEVYSNHILKTLQALRTILSVCQQLGYLRCTYCNRVSLRPTVSAFSRGIEDGVVKDWCPECINSVGNALKLVENGVKILVDACGRHVASRFETRLADARYLTLFEALPQSGGFKAPVTSACAT